jgi:hypothetical protein
MKKIRTRMIAVPLRLLRSREMNPRLLRHLDRIHVFVIVDARLMPIENTQLNAS